MLFALPREIATPQPKKSEIRPTLEPHFEFPPFFPSPNGVTLYTPLKRNLSMKTSLIPLITTSQQPGLYCFLVHNQNETSMLLIDIKSMFFNVLSDVSHTWFSSLDLDLDSDLD